MLNLMSFVNVPIFLYNLFIVVILPVLRTFHEIRTLFAAEHFSLCFLQCYKKYTESSSATTLAASRRSLILCLAGYD